MSARIHIYVQRVYHDFCWAIQYRLDEIKLRPIMKILKADFHKYNFDRDTFDIYRKGIVIACVNPDYVDENAEYDET